MFIQEIVKLAILQDGVELYNHESENYTDSYNPNTALVRTQLHLVKGYEIQMKNMYRNFGVEKFGTELGKVELKIK